MVRSYPWDVDFGLSIEQRHIETSVDSDAVDGGVKYVADDFSI